MKLTAKQRFIEAVKTHLARDAWIEMSSVITSAERFIGRISQEMRGLKLLLTTRYFFAVATHLARDAWIEMVYGVGTVTGKGGRISQEMRGLK